MQRVFQNCHCALGPQGTLPPGHGSLAHSERVGQVCSGVLVLSGPCWNLRGQDGSPKCGFSTPISGLPREGQWEGGAQVGALFGFHPGKRDRQELAQTLCRHCLHCWAWSSLLEPCLWEPHPLLSLLGTLRAPQASAACLKTSQLRCLQPQRAAWGLDGVGQAAWVVWLRGLPWPVSTSAHLPRSYPFPARFRSHWYLLSSPR